MKKNTHFNQFHPTRWAAFLGVPAIILGLSTFSGTAQDVVIEGGPGAVQISDEDGEIEPSTPLNNPVELDPEAAVGVALPRIEEPGTPPSPRPPSTTVRAEDLVVPAPPTNPKTSRDEVTSELKVSVTEKVAPNEEVVDPEKMKRLAELRRELKIAESATVAKVVFKDTELFDGDESVAINSLATPTLEKVAEYIQLGGSEEITVKSRYVPGEGNKDLSWKRSLVLIDWMKNSGVVALEDIKAMGPVPVTEAVAVEKPNSSDNNSTELVSMIEVEIR